MVRLRSLEKDGNVDYSVTEIIFHEDFMLFNRWYELACKRYPNATRVLCRLHPLNKTRVLTYIGTKDINCSYCDLEELYCPNATNVNCTNNRLRILECSNVKILNCYNNNLISLHVPEVIGMSCTHNPIEELYCPKVEVLDCSNTLIKEIDCPNLLELRCYASNIQEICVHEAEVILCNDCPNLVSLYAPKAFYIECWRCPIETLFCPLVKNLRCYKTKITKLEVPYAYHVWCEDCLLVELIAPNVEFIECSNNKLEYLNLPNANEVVCNSNQLIEINLPIAEQLFCQNNPLQYINAPKLELLYFTTDIGTIIPINNPNIKLYDNNNPLNFDEEVAKVTRIAQRKTKSARS